MSILTRDEELITALKAHLQSGALRTEQLRVELDVGRVSLEEYLQITKQNEECLDLSYLENKGI